MSGNKFGSTGIFAFGLWYMSSPSPQDSSYSGESTSKVLNIGSVANGSGLYKAQSLNIFIFLLPIPASFPILLKAVIVALLENSTALMFSESGKEKKFEGIVFFSQVCSVIFSNLGLTPFSSFCISITILPSESKCVTILTPYR